MCRIKDLIKIKHNERVLFIILSLCCLLYKFSDYIKAKRALINSKKGHQIDDNNMLTHFC